MKLIFVYNSDGNFASLIKDTAHKVVSPKTYPCNLCRLTYPLASMDEGWKKFIHSLPHEAIFFHRDEFHKKFPSQKNTPLPAVFKEESSGLSLIIPSAEINKAKSVEDLISIVKDAVSKLH